MDRDKTVNEVKVTTDYLKFHFIDGNRDVNRMRVKKIEKSVKKVGFIPVPIVANNSFGIIDGQARFTYCKENQLPIYYIIIQNIGRQECAALNDGTTNWKTIDYINLYASEGNDSYIFAKSLFEKYKLPIRIILYCCTDSQAGAKSASINSGKLYIDPKNYDFVDETAEFLSQFQEIGKMSGWKENMYLALIWIKRHTDVDLNRIKSIFPKIAASGYSLANVDDALHVIEDAYNSRIKNKFYFRLEYSKYQDQKTAMYHTKYAENMRRALGEQHDNN